MTDTRQLDTRLPHIVILGAGFGGLFAARHLCHAPARVTVVDRSNHHVFQPLLYQVATAGLSAIDVASPIRKILRSCPNTAVLMDEAVSIDVHRQRVLLTSNELEYDYLVVATGATHAYFGHDQWARDAPGLKNIEDAIEIRRRVLAAYESAERGAMRGQDVMPWLTFAIVGGGPTGVELAGALAEIARYTLARDFRYFDPRSARVLLIEAVPRILPSFPENLSAEAARRLSQLGVEVRTGCMVTHVDRYGLNIGDERIEARTVLWAAGVQASALTSSLHTKLDKAGRVLVQPDLTVPGHPEVFVIGDAARLEQDGRPIPGVAQAAIQQGRHVADNILRALDGEPMRPFRYVDKGSLAAIGRSSAIADLGKVQFTGFVGWLIWLLVHIFFLIGFRNRVAVVLEWAWAYLTAQRSARVIVSVPATEREEAIERLRSTPELTEALERQVEAERPSGEYGPTPRESEAAR